MYSNEAVDTDVIKIKYGDPFILMNHLKAMGESNAVKQRRSTINKDTLMAAASIYKSLYGDEDGGVPATFQIIYLIAWKPHKSQPQVN